MSPKNKIPKVKRVKSQDKATDARGCSRATTLKHIRGILGRTQAELANAMGLSAKAVQSYEQGWREVPVRVMIQLLILLALFRKHTMDDVPCWEIRKCNPAHRSRCASFTMGRGQFCWFVGSRHCLPARRKRSGSFLPCMDCPVIRRLLGDKPVSG
ncbi:MAG: helix-turn-helix transcriptional regulator [bacterium]